MITSIYVAIALAISVAGNGLLGWAYLGQRDKTTQAISEVKNVTEQRDGALKAADNCSQATEKLKLLADQRKKEADSARAAAIKKTESHNKRADVILATTPSVPGNDCASAQELQLDWLGKRTLP